MTLSSPYTLSLLSRVVICLTKKGKINLMYNNVNMVLTKGRLQMFHFKNSHQTHHPWPPLSPCLFLRRQWLFGARIPFSALCTPKYSLGSHFFYCPASKNASVFVQTPCSRHLQNMLPAGLLSLQPVQLIFFCIWEHNLVSLSALQIQWPFCILSQAILIPPTLYPYP